MIIDHNKINECSIDHKKIFEWSINYKKINEWSIDHKEIIEWSIDHCHYCENQMRDNSEREKRERRSGGHAVIMTMIIIMKNYDVDDVDDDDDDVKGKTWGSWGGHNRLGHCPGFFVPFSSFLFSIFVLLDKFLEYFDNCIISYVFGLMFMPFSSLSVFIFFVC